MTNVLIVDDERMVRELFEMYIQSASDRYTLVDAVDDAQNAEFVCLGQKVPEPTAFGTRMFQKKNC